MNTGAHSPLRLWNRLRCPFPLLLLLLLLGNNIRHSIHLLHHPSRTPNRHREIGNVLGHHTPRPNGAAFTDGDARHDGDVAADPAVVANGDGGGVLDAVAAGLDAYFVRGGKDGDEGAEEDAVADGDHAAVEDY